jgi:S-DNA-T family DNA segregation ATPase FtsK/SpoIIIE
LGRGLAPLARRLLHAAVGQVRHPVRFLAVAALGVGVLALAREVGTRVGVGVLGALVALGLWRLVGPGWYRRWVSWRLRGWWRRRWVYRRRWRPVLVACGLVVKLDGTEQVARLGRVRCTDTVDQVRVRPLVGQLVEDYAAAAPRLAAGFGARECRVRTTRRGWLVLWLLSRDPLRAIVPAFPPASTGAGVDLTGLPVALGEDGLVYRLRLLGSHLLIVGATGSGKGSVLWSLLHALGPAIRDGQVAVWALDPKGGMELAGGAGLFARFSYGDPDQTTAGARTAGSVGPGAGTAAGVVAHELEFAAVLEDAVAVMRRRQEALRGITRLHTPSTAEPLLLVVVDEVASLTGYVTDRDAKRRIGAALALLLSQGRAVGVLVVGAVQDPRKETLTVRDLFPTRVLLRVTEPDQVALVLGTSARERGARAELIPETLPGVGYVGIDGLPEPVRVRFTHHTDADIAALVAAYAPRHNLGGASGLPSAGVAA